MEKSNLDMMKIKDIIQNSFFLRLPGAQDILNLGAADGIFYEKYPWKNYNLTNVDNNSENDVFKNDCLTKYSNYPNIKNVKTDCFDLSMFTEDEFDMVIFTHLIEHLTPDEIEKTLLEIQRVLKNNGILVVATPNFTIRNYLGAANANEFHIKEFTYDELNEIITPKFKILKEYGVLNIDVDSGIIKPTKIDDPKNSYVIWMVCRNEKKETN